MPRRRHYVLAAILVLGLASYAARISDCLSAEPFERSPILGNSPALPSENSAARNAEPLWPGTWKWDSGFTFRLRGRVDTDAIWSTQSPANVATFGNLGDVVGLRRARIGAEGDLGTDSRYVAEIDMPSGVVIPRDVYAAFGNRQEATEFQFGHFREPFSLEGGTSARYFAFMERSPVNLLDPARNWGIGLFRENVTDNSALAFGAFHAGTDSGDFQGGDGSTVGFTGRLTSALVNLGDGKQLLHLGLSLSERVPESGVIIINQQPRSPLLDLGDSSTSPFVPAINIPARFQQLINVQFAAVNGPLWTQAEWYGSLIDQTGGGTVFFRGCHVDCGYFLTGEHRKYDSSSGTFGAVRVARPWYHGLIERNRPLGWGAWELTTRFAYLDFFDPDTPPGMNGQLIGIQLPQWTSGVNWYMSDRVRLMFNYSYDVPNEVNTGRSSANIFATRLAVYW
jgi:phosphate-selective porin OprO/OprP